MKNILIVGLLFGFAGFLIETIGFSLEKKRFIYAGDKLFWGIPLLPVYSAGGLLMHYVIRSMAGYPWYLTIFFAWLVVCVWEFLAGFFCLKVYKKRFWDYSKRKLNLKGHVCALNSAWWLVFVSLYYFFIFVKVDAFLAGQV
jgi:uncharacterized membrane protein